MGIIRVSNSGVFVVESGVAAVEGTPTPPTVLPQQGNIQLRWDFSVADDVWADSGKTTPITDGTLIALAGAQGSGAVVNQADLLQPTAGNRPTWDEDGINGLGAALFDDVRPDFFNRSIATNGISSGDMTVFAAFAPDAATSNLYVFNYTNRSPSLQAQNSSVIHPNFGGVDTAATVSSAYTPNETLGVIMTDDGANAQAYRYSHDSTNDISAITTAGPSNGTTLWVGTFASGGDFSGLLGELMFWSPSLTSGEMDTLQAWAFEKWGMVWA